jgi:hypothetical protein
MINEENRQSGAGHPARGPYHIKLPGFISGEEIGLGDAIKKATSYLALKPCRGCEQRAAALNRWLIFSGRRLPAPRM